MIMMIAEVIILQMTLHTPTQRVQASSGPLTHSAIPHH